jgi:O-antigen ligase
MLLDELAPYEIGGFPITQNKALTSVLLVLVLVQWAFVRRRLPHNDKTKWILAFYLSLALSSIYAAIQGLDEGVLGVRWTTFLATVIFYFLLCYVIQTRRHLDLLFVALLVGGVVVSISAWFSEGDAMRWAVRETGFGANANLAAGNLLTILPLTYALATTTRSSFKKGVFLGTAMVIVLGCVLAGSRSAVAAAPIMGALYFARIRRLPDLRLVVVLVLLVAIGIAASPKGYGDRLKAAASFVEEAGEQKGQRSYSVDLEGRILIYKTSLIALATHPILGIGVARYQDWARTRTRGFGGSLDRLKESHNVVHNAVLTVAAQQGLLGVIPYIAILILTYRDFSRAQRLARSRRDLGDPELEALHLRALMAQIGFIGMVVFIQFHGGVFWRVLWAMIAFSTIILSLTRKRLAELAEEVPVRSVEEPGTLLPGSFPQHVGALTRTPQQN